MLPTTAKTCSADRILSVQVAEYNGQAWPPGQDPPIQVSDVPLAAVIDPSGLPMTGGLTYAPVNSVSITFSTPVNAPRNNGAFFLASLGLTLNGAPVAFNGTPLTSLAGVPGITLQPASVGVESVGGATFYQVWSLTGLAAAGLTGTGGTYQLTLATNSGISDYVYPGEMLSTPLIATWTMSTDTISGTPLGRDRIAIAADHNSPSTQADVSIGNAIATSSYSVPFAQVTQWSLSGTSGDTATLDFSNGDPIPEDEPLTYTGSSSNNDSLVIEDSSNTSDTVVVTGSQVTVNGRAIDYSNVPNLTVNLSGPQNNLTVDGTGVTGLTVNVAMSSAASVTVTGGATINLGGHTTTVGNVNVTNGSVVNGRLVTSGLQTVQAGTIAAGLGGAAGLLEDDGGSDVLSGTATYAGATVVTNGTLLVNGRGALPSGGALYVGMLPTTVSVTSSLPSAVYGQTVTFMATITGSMLLPVSPTGSVTFMDGSTVLGTVPLTAGGQAAFSTSSLVAATHTIFAVYNGDANFVASTASISQTVNQDTTTSLAMSSTSFGYGQQVTLTANVNGTTPDSGTPTGTVTFKAGSWIIGTASLSAGTAVLATTNVPAGADSITVVYAGEGVDLGSTSPAVSATVALAPLTITASPRSKTYGTALRPGDDSLHHEYALQRRHRDGRDAREQRGGGDGHRERLALHDHCERRHGQRPGQLLDYLCRRQPDGQSRAADDHGQPAEQDLRGSAEPGGNGLHHGHALQRRRGDGRDAREQRGGRFRDRERLALRDQCERRRGHGPGQLLDHLCRRQFDGQSRALTVTASPQSKTYGAAPEPGNNGLHYEYALQRRRRNGRDAREQRGGWFRGRERLALHDHCDRRHGQRPGQLLNHVRGRQPDGQSRAADGHGQPAEQDLRGSALAWEQRPSPRARSTMATR